MPASNRIRSREVLIAEIRRFEFLLVATRRTNILFVSSKEFFDRFSVLELNGILSCFEHLHDSIRIDNELREHLS